MSRLGEGACGTGVGFIGAKSMAPAIIHGCIGSSVLVIGCVVLFVGECCRCIGKALVLCGEDAHAFAVGFVEVLSEIVPCVFNKWSGTPFMEGLSEHTGVFKVDDGRSDGGGIADGIVW